MTRVFLEKRDLELEYTTDCLVIREPEQPPRTLPLRKVNQIVCLHNTKVTTQLIGQLHARGIDLVVLNLRYEQNSFALYADQQKVVERRCKQYQWQVCEEPRMTLAKTWVRRKLIKIKRITHLHQLPIQPHFLDGIDAQIHNPTLTEDQLRGLEGWMQRTLFEAWRSRVPKELGFVKRVRRPPTDPINATLSLAYTFVYQEAIRQCKAAGLDSQLGFFHKACFGRHSLACDLMEPVRPKIEAWVFSLFLQGTLNKRHFSSSQKACLLGKKGREVFYQEYETAWCGFSRELRAACTWLARILDQED